MVTGFALANDPNSKVVALNLVQAEDGSGVNAKLLAAHADAPVSAADVSAGASQSARGRACARHRAAGRLDLSHSRLSDDGASRIGLVMASTSCTRKTPHELLREMARRNVMVEICLSSNDSILGVSGAQHPLATYLKYGVPVALATDDEGVSRSEISREYLRAAQDQGLGYLHIEDDGPQQSSSMPSSREAVSGATDADSSR